MALLFLDSFDHYTAAFAEEGLTDKYTAGSGTIGNLYGRHGNGFVGSAVMGLSGIASSKAIVGLAVRFGSFGGASGLSLGDIHGTYYDVDAIGAGCLRITGPDGVAHLSAIDTLHTGTWFYLEVETVVAPASPDPDDITVLSARAWIDGQLVLDIPTGLGTYGSPYGVSAYGWTQVVLGGSTNAVSIDDVYVLDGAGPAPWNAPLGDVQIDVIRPNGAGASTQWTVVGAPTNFGAVDDPTPDDDATKVIAATAGLADLYQLEDINTNNGIIGAQLLISARRTEEGFATLTPLLRHAGVTTALVPRAISPTYFYRNRDCFVVMPNGDPLTDANVNALQAGMRRDA
jgi:hypothetical protein